MMNNSTWEGAKSLISYHVRPSGKSKSHQQMITFKLSQYYFPKRSLVWSDKNISNSKARWQISDISHIHSSYILLLWRKWAAVKLSPKLFQPVQKKNIHYSSKVQSFYKMNHFVDGHSLRKIFLIDFCTQILFKRKCVSIKGNKKRRETDKMAWMTQ